MIKLLKGNCLEQMKSLPDNSVDSIVTDPPYGISFMAKRWDYDVPSVEVWQEAMRVLKPGGHALIACGTRTQHRMVVNIEDAGFEIRDVVSWIYGSGFPKSLNIHKKDERCPDGWGTALKPACEFFTLARKPLSEKTIAKNVLKWGTGGINIDGCRVASDGSHMVKGVVTKRTTVAGDDRKDAALGMYGAGASFAPTNHEGGRFPANLIHDGSQEVLDLFPETKPSKIQPRNQAPREAKSKGAEKARTGVMGHNDNGGSAARFFYCPKASKKDRDEGLEGFDEKKTNTLNDYKNPSEGRTASKSGGVKKNNHPTVKPTALMQYLCRLITPAGGVVLDPYMGSGSTGKAAIKEGFGFVGCELDEDYFLIASQRVKNELD